MNGNGSQSLIGRAKRTLGDLERVSEWIGNEPQAAASQFLPTAVPEQQSRSVVSPEIEPSQFEELDEALDATRRRILESGRRALEKVQLDDERAEFSSDEALGLEAVINVVGRPALLIQSGHFARAMEPWSVLEEVRGSIERISQSVGRIDVEHDRLDLVGTGFLVADDVIMTNRHVVECFCQSRGGGIWSFRSTYCPQIDYMGEWGTASFARFAITDVIGVAEDEHVDLGLLRVASDSQDPTPVPAPLLIASTCPDGAEGRPVYAIGYPYVRYGDPEILRRVFGDVFGYKRLLPGMLTELLPSRRQFRHDCSTLGGNSGSCVVDLESGQVIGLHFRGRYRKYNSAVALWNLCTDPLLSRAGVKFD